MTSGANNRFANRKLCLRGAKAWPLRLTTLAPTYAGLTSLRYNGFVQNRRFKTLVRMPIALAILMGGAMTSPVQADTRPMEAQVAVVRPLSFIKVEDLYFGRVLASNTAGTVTLAPDGTRTTTGGATLAGSWPSQVARFAGDGTQNQMVNVSIGANSIFITGPGTRMRVRNFVIGSVPVNNLSTTPIQLRLSAAPGTFNFPVGATLEVGANQAPGRYTGTWTITLNYQ